MPTPGQLLYATLTQAPETAALLGTRISPNRLAAGTKLPAAVYQLINRQPTTRTLRPCSTSDDNRLQVTLYATTYAELEAVSAAVRQALSAAPSPFVYEDEGDQYDEDANIGGRRQDYSIRLSPTT